LRPKRFATIARRGIHFKSFALLGDALGTMNALRPAGRLIPGDVAVAGFDGMPGSEYWHPPLTTARHQVYALGATAARLLAEHVAGDLRAVPRVVLPVELVARASTVGTEGPASRAFRTAAVV
jgi:ABC-type sugar transport system substrate-binding protein